MKSEFTISKFFELYSGCDSYHDIGVVKTVAEQIEFETEFKRATSFTFKWKDSRGENEIVFRNGTVSSRFQSFSAPSKYDSLKIALSSVMGVTLGASSIIYTLLHPNEPIANVFNKEILSVEDIGDYSIIRYPALEAWINPKYELSRVRWLTHKSQHPTDSRMAGVDEHLDARIRLNASRQADGNSPSIIYQKATFNYAVDRGV